MAQRLAARTQQRSAQRSVRVASNSINKAHDEWKEITRRGREKATALSNAILTLTDLETLPLGVLSNVSDLRQSCRDRLLERMQSSIASLRSAHDELETVLATARSVLEETYSLELEMTSAAGGPTYQPVFGALSLSAIVQGLREWEECHAQGLEMKLAALACFEQRVGLLTQAAWGDGAGLVHPALGSLPAAALSKQPSRQELGDKLSVWISAWMLDLEPGATRADHWRLRIMADMAGF